MPYEEGLGRKLIDTLPSDIPGLFNPWKDTCANDLPWNTPAEKLARLEAHLNCDARYILCGEAPGHLGARHSGISFHSEAMLLGGQAVRQNVSTGRLTVFPGPLKEPSATIVWKNLYLLGIAERTLVWNAVQLHPHEIGKPRTNRTPKDFEVEYGRKSLLMLREAYPETIVIAVGKTAGRLLDNVGIKAECIRHPANGGATEFANGLRRIVQANS